MKFNFIKKMSMAALSAAMVAAPAINIFAAPEDIIDEGMNGNATITVHKYDMTAMDEDGVRYSDFLSDGKQNTAAEETMKRYVVEGVEFSYLKVADINTISENGKIQVMYNLPDALAQIIGVTTDRSDHMYSSDAINDALKNLLVDNTAAKDALEKYIAGGQGVQSMVTDASGVAKATNLQLGLYLMVETKVPANVHTTVDPFFVSVPMTDVEGTAWFYDVHVYPKNQTNIPDLDKTVRQNDDAVLYDDPEYRDTATASQNDKVDYLIVSHLPKITSTATYLTKYDFIDKVTKGIVYNKDAVIYFYDNKTDAETNNTEKAVAKWEIPSGNSGSTVMKGDKFEADYSAAFGNANSVTYRMTEEGLKEINTEHSEQWMVISYSATLSKDAFLGDVGNTNDVRLDWKRTNMNFPDHLEDRARVFSYGINLQKNFKQDSNSKSADPTKVTFSLQNKTNGYYVTATKVSEGVYDVTDSVKGTNEPGQDADGEKAGTGFKPGPDGKLIINGLEADEYVLTELRTDAGYTLLKEPITIKINATEDKFEPSQTTLYDSEDKANNQHKEMIETNGKRASATVDGKDTKMSEQIYTTGGTGAGNINSTNARVDMTVTNTPGFTLPQTGGAGTIAFTIAGCAAAAAGVAVITKKSKKDVKED